MSDPQDDPDHDPLGRLETIDDRDNDDGDDDDDGADASAASDPGAGDTGRLELDDEERYELGHSPAASRTSDDPDEDPDEVEYTELVAVFNARALAEAQLVKSILESFHIPAAIQDDVNADVALRGSSFLSGVDVQVPGRLAAKARAVLCERGIQCTVEPGDVAAHEPRLRAALTDEVARDALADELDAEPRRELRQGVLARLSEHGGPGLQAALALATRSVERAEGEAHLGLDLAQLVNRGVFGGAASPRTVGVLSRLAASPAPAARRRAAEALGKLKEAGAEGALITLLEDEDSTVRDEAVESLFFLSNGVNHGFRAEAPESERREAVARWREWLARQRGAEPPMIPNG